MERKKIVNICSSFSTVTNNNSWIAKSALSNVVSLVLFLTAKKKEFPTDPLAISSFEIGRLTFANNTKYSSIFWFLGYEIEKWPVGLL